MAPKRKYAKNNEEFEVERIVGDKYEGRKRYFLIKWRGYPASTNTWEPEENLTKCTKLIRDYFNGKGLRNSKENTLSTTLLRSLKVSKQRRSSITSLIAVSSPKSSRKLIVSIVDANISQKENNLSVSKPLAVAESEDFPRVQLVRIDLPEALSKVPFEPAVDEPKGLHTQCINKSSVNENSPESTQLSDSSNMSLSIQLSDDSANDHSPKLSEMSNLSSECLELTEVLPRVSSLASADLEPVELRSTEMVLSPPDINKSASWESNKPDAERSTNNNVDPPEYCSTSVTCPEVLSAPAVLDEDLDEIEDSDEELLKIRIFDELGSDDETSVKKTKSKKRRRKRY